MKQISLESLEIGMQKGEKYKTLATASCNNHDWLSGNENKLMIWGVYKKYLHLNYQNDANK